jgi:hypothetical protein
MSGFDDFNFPAFFNAEKKLKKSGHVPWNPAQKDIDEWGNIENIKKKANYRDCMRKDLNCLLDWAEAIYLLNGWEQSRGAKIEKALAEVLNLEIIYEE